MLPLSLCLYLPTLFNSFSGILILSQDPGLVFVTQISCPEPVSNWAPDLPEKLHCFTLLPPDKTKTLNSSQSYFLPHFMGREGSLIPPPGFSISPDPTLRLCGALLSPTILQELSCLLLCFYLISGPQRCLSGFELLGPNLCNFSSYVFT